MAVGKGSMARASKAVKKAVEDKYAEECGNYQQIASREQKGFHILAEVIYEQVTDNICIKVRPLQKKQIYYYVSYNENQQAYSVVFQKVADDSQSDIFCLLSFFRFPFCFSDLFQFYIQLPIQFL